MELLHEKVHEQKIPPVQLCGMHRSRSRVLVMDIVSVKADNLTPIITGTPGTVIFEDQADTSTRWATKTTWQQQKLSTTGT